MTDPIEEPKGTLPEGEVNPNLIYVAVGKAIHHWEEMEMAIAKLFLKMSAIEDIPSNYTDYGTKNRRFSERMAALQDAGAAYFVRRSDQEKEGVFCGMVEKIESLSIDRHRIAHGHISMVGEFKFPQGGKPSEIHEVTAILLYRWGAPFYSTGSLRTNFVGGAAKTIDLTREKFMAMQTEIRVFTEALAP